MNLNEEILRIRAVMGLLNESALDEVKQVVAKYFENGIKGRLLNKEQSLELEREIESNYVDGDSDLFNKDDIRMSIYNYDNPYIDTDINGVQYKVVMGLIRTDYVEGSPRKIKTWLLYGNGEIIGEFKDKEEIIQILKYLK